MNEKTLNIFENGDVDIDLRRCSEKQVGTLLDLVQFDRFLDYVYATLLKREPDRQGRTHYHALTGKGMTRAAVVRRLLRSREYRSSSIEAAGLPVDDFINRVYQDTLGRWPDQDGLETYRRIASRPNGRRKVIANLQASGEAVRKGGGRLARIKVLRRYARSGWSTRLPVVGPWFARHRQRRRRIDRIALNQHLLAEQVASLREDVEAARLGAATPFSFVSENRSGGMADAIFQNALTRARRET